MTWRENDCASAGYDPLHMASSQAGASRDPEIESLLNQSADPRLAWVNRQMYLSLRSLDVELRRERRVAECEQQQSSPTLEARVNAGDGGASASGGGTIVGGTAGGGSQASGGGSMATAGADVAANSPAVGTSNSIVVPPAASQSSMAAGTTAAQARSTLVRKTSLSPLRVGREWRDGPKDFRGQRQ